MICSEVNILGRYEQLKIFTVIENEPSIINITSKINHSSTTYII